MKTRCSRIAEAPAGLAGLPDADLIAFLTGDRRGAEALLEAHGALNEVARLSTTEIARCTTPARAERLAAALELGRRAQAPRSRDLALSTPADVYRYARPRMAHLPNEVFHVLLLDSRHRLIADRRVAEGGLSSCAVSPRDCFESAIREAAPAVLFLHNHPSGDPTPSRDDVALTRRLREASTMLGISLVDHVVVADGGYVSLLEQGKL